MNMLASVLETSLEEGMATCSSILAWRIPWTEGPGRLQPIALQRVGHDWALMNQKTNENKLTWENQTKVKKRKVKKKNVYLEETQENWIIPPNGQTLTFNTIFMGVYA